MKNGTILAPQGKGGSGLPLGAGRWGAPRVEGLQGAGVTWGGTPWWGSGDSASIPEGYK